MNQFSEEDRRLAEECAICLQLYNSEYEQLEKAILETVIKKKNERINRIEELLCRCIHTNTKLLSPKEIMEWITDDSQWQSSYLCKTRSIVKKNIDK